MALSARGRCRVRPCPNTRLRDPRQSELRARVAVGLIPATTNVAVHDSTLGDAEGSPWARSLLPTPASTPGDGNLRSFEFESDPTRLVSLAIIYAQLINGTPIQQGVPRGASLKASALTDPLTSTPLPLIDVAGRASTRAEAARVAQAGADRFRSYIRDQQASSGVSLNQRVLLQVVSTQAQLVAGRKKTLAIVAFLAVMIATVGLAFVLENLRPEHVCR